MAAVHGRVAGRAVAAAIARAPHAPRLFECDWLRRRLEYLAVRKRDVVGQFFALGRKTDGAAAIHVASAINERIEHDVEELIGELEASLLRPGRRFARKKRQRIGEIGVGEREERQERRRERRIVEEIIDGGGDGLVIRAQACRLLRSTKRGGHIQQHVRLGVTQACRETWRQVGGLEVLKSAAERAERLVQDVVALGWIAYAWCEHRLHSARKRYRPPFENGDGAGCRGIDLHEVDSSGLKCEVGGPGEADDRHRAGCICRNGS